MKIVLGPASTELGMRIAEILNSETVPVFSKTFPDGESYVRIEGNVKSEETVIVQTTSPPQNSRLVQLALMADAAKRGKAKKVTAVVPYLAYARQDRVFLEGEAVSIEAVAKMLRAAGIDALITVNVHHEEALEKFPFEAKNLSAISFLAEYFKGKELEGAFALAPDKGATYMAEQAGKILGGEWGYLEKRRDRYTGQVSVEKGKFDVKDKAVVIFDDIISTGGTIVAAIKVLKEIGAEKVYVACVHPLLIGDAEKRIVEAGAEEIVGTDSIPSHVSKVSLAPLIGRALKEL